MFKLHKQFIAVLACCFNSHGFRSYWQEYEEFRLT